MAYALYSRLLRAVKASGLPYTVVGGAASRGRGTMRSIETVTAHHTATPRSYRRGVDYPTMNVVKNGRPGLPGPLAQLGLGRSGRVYLIASGIANHAGRSRAASMTNSHAIGIEAEGANEKWPAAQYDAYVRLVRALLDEFDLPTSRALRHAETASPPGRKVDASFSGPAFRRALDARRKSKPAPQPKPTAPAPKKEGLFGMALIGQGTNRTRRTIGAGKTARIAVGKHFSLATVKKHQTISAVLHLDVEGLFGAESATARLILGAYNPKAKPDTRIDWRYPDVTIHGIDGGHRVRTPLPLIDRVGSGPNAGESLRLQLEVTNPTGHDITVVYTGYKVLGD